jgi:hypothetical protein
MNTPERLCERLNKLLNLLPSFKEPSRVPFNNGLYFFYEKGEISRHAPDGRIVRIGNHPLSQDSLKRRLRMHYSEARMAAFSGDSSGAQSCVEQIVTTLA